VARDAVKELEHRGDGQEARERRDQQVIELLNELRVAIPGVQILFGFLLTVPFTQRWGDTSEFQRIVFFVALIAVTAATAFLIAPTGMHRLRFHQRDRAFLVEYANRMAIAGLLCLAVALSAAVLLITDVLWGSVTVAIVTVAVSGLLGGLWFGLPVGRGARERD
jgi:ABC-type multidrug transport system permease subunit